MSHRPPALLEREHTRTVDPRRARAPEPSPNSQSAPPGTASSISVSSPRRRLERFVRAVSQARENRTSPYDELPSILASLRNASDGTETPVDSQIYSFISSRRPVAGLAQEDGESDSSATVPEDPEDEYPAARDMFLRLGVRRRHERQNAIEWTRFLPDAGLEQREVHNRDRAGREGQTMLLHYEHSLEGDNKRGLRWRLTCGAVVWDWRANEIASSSHPESDTEPTDSDLTVPASTWSLGPPHPLPIHPEEPLPRDYCAPITRFPQQRTGCGLILESCAVQGELDTYTWVALGYTAECIRLVPCDNRPCGCQFADAACAKCTKQVGKAFTPCKQHANGRNSTIIRFFRGDVQAARVPLRSIPDLPREKLRLDPGSLYW